MCDLMIVQYSDRVSHFSTGPTFPLRTHLRQAPQSLIKKRFAFSPKSL